MKLDPSGLGKIQHLKLFVALARVSSREQEREGFSLDVQEDALRAYAERNGGMIVQFYKIAETASKADERKAFKQLIAYVKANAARLAGILFYKVDRAARNLFDYVELERLESTYGIPFISISQPTENTPAGRLNRRVLATMASFTTEQQSLDVREGLAKRAEAGLFVGMTPYGYCNQRVNGRSIIEVVPNEADNVRLAFELYAHQNHTIDSLVDKLNRDQVKYTSARPSWPRSKMHTILRDRSYIGELRYKGQWLPGAHEPLIDRTIWDRVQVRLGEKVYLSHELTFAGELIDCGHCGAPITGEAVTKKQTGKTYVYYRCSRNNRLADHPRVRLREAELDEQIVHLFRRIRQPEPVAEMFQDMLRDWSDCEHSRSTRADEDSKRQLTSLTQQQDQLLNMRLANEIDAVMYGRKNVELRDRIASLKSQLNGAEQNRRNETEMAQKVFELSQSLESKWITAPYTEKRQLLDLVCLNFRLDDVTLVPEMRKPFDMLAEGQLVSSSRGDKI